MWVLLQLLRRRDRQPYIGELDNAAIEALPE